MKSFYLIGLCGRSGSGKGYVSAMFAEHGFGFIDLDQVYRELTCAPGDNDCMIAIVSEFGKDAAMPDGSLNRQYLADIVFGDKSGESLKRLNGITHRFVLERADMIASELAEQGKRYILLDAPALYESGADKKCLYNVCVVADDIVRIDRICERDGISREKAMLRLSSQMTDEELTRLSDFVIPNNNDEDETRRAVINTVRSIMTEQG